MTRLEELLYSLATVIVHYHDSQPKVKKLIVETNEEVLREKSLTCAKEIIQNKDIHFKTRLNDLIKRCADSSRRPFLYYILHEVTSLKALLDKTSSFEPTKLEEYKNQIFQLFIDFKLLLDTQKHKTYRVTYSKIEDTAETSIALSGLKNDGYIGGDLCNSGEILNNEVLRRFNITARSSKDEIRGIAEQICMEHHNALLVPELLTQNAAQKKLNLEQEQKLDSLSTQYKENQKKMVTTSGKQQMALYLFYIQFKRMHAKEEKQKTVIEQQQETIKELRQKINELIKPIDSKPVNHRFYSPSL